MATIKRWRVRTMARTYTESGPDLLQTNVVAANDFGRTMGKQHDGWFIRVNPEKGGKWSPNPHTRAEVLKKYSAWQRRSGDEIKFQVGRKDKGKIDPKVESLSIHVRHLVLPNVNPGANLVADLARANYDNLSVGGFSCREYNNIPGSGWSDHAWGDAVDMWGPNNDALTDWCVRMGRAGLMGATSQFIGSRDGHVGSHYSPDFAWNPGGPESHLTHVHCSYRQHFGTNPHCS